MRPGGANGATVLFGHPRMDPASLGMRTGGLLLSAPVTFSEIGRGHVVRAQMESAAFTIRANLEQLERAAGVRARAVRLGGGMTRMPVFGEIVAAVLGRQIDVSAERNVSALGAYLRATAVLSGRSVSEAVSDGRVRLAALEPDPLAASEYKDAYGRWLELAKDMEGWDAVSEDFADARRMVASAAREMAALGLATGSSGNVSLRLADGLFAVTPSGVPYTRLRDEEVVIIDGDAEPVEPQDGAWSQPDLMPSSETLLHLAIYAARPDAGAVVHTHAVYSSVAAGCGPGRAAHHRRDDAVGRRAGESLRVSLSRHSGACRQRGGGAGKSATRR